MSSNIFKFEDDTDRLTKISRVLENHPYLSFLEFKNPHGWRVGLTQTVDNKSYFMYDLDRIQDGTKLQDFLQLAQRWWDSSGSKRVPFEIFILDRIKDYNHMGMIIPKRSIIGEPIGYVYDINKDYNAKLFRTSVEII